MPEPVFTVANQLTMLRMTLVPAFVLLALARAFSWALVVFVVAGLTDALDGYVARHANQSTRLGAMLDPVATQRPTALEWDAPGRASCTARSRPGSP